MNYRKLLWTPVLVSLGLLLGAVQPANSYEYGNVSQDHAEAWCCMDITYCVNPREFDTLCTPTGIPTRNFVQTVNAAAATWNAQGTMFQLIFNGLTSDSGCVTDAFTGNCIGSQDGQNVVSVLKSCSFPAGVLATSFWWYTVNPGGPDDCCIFESDICFSNDFSWFEDSTAADCAGSCYDLESVALHEFGHWISLGHEPDDVALGYRPSMYPS